MRNKPTEASVSKWTVIVEDEERNECVLQNQKTYENVLPFGLWQHAYPLYPQIQMISTVS
jgi:hypothetical protein